MAVQYLHDGSPDGCTIVQAITDKLSIYGGTAITQPASASQAVVSVSAGTTSTCTIVASLQSLATANKTLVNELRNNLVSLTAIKGSA